MKGSRRTGESMPGCAAAALEPQRDAERLEQERQKVEGRCAREACAYRYPGLEEKALAMQGGVFANPYLALSIT